MMQVLVVNASQKFFEIIVSAYFEFRFYIEHKENNPISVSGGTLLSQLVVKNRQAVGQYRAESQSMVRLLSR